MSLLPGVGEPASPQSLDHSAFHTSSMVRGSRGSGNATRMHSLHCPLTIH